MTRRIVGFDRKIEREWLDYAAAQASEGLSSQDMRSRLWDFLDSRVSAGSSGWNSDRGKVITVLMRIWGPGEGRYERLRQGAVAALGGASPQSRIALHWALCLGSYPFFADVARATGQHLALHGEAQLSEVRRRLVEGWGDRAVTRRATQRILRSMIDWGVLEDGPSRGVYVSGPVQPVSEPALGELLVMGLLLAQDGEAIPAEKLRSHPAVFPFQVEQDVLALGQGASLVRLEREALGSRYLRLAGG
ncbi:MAG: hypothetical protein KDD11_19840 [Acidobacteria bacterium]|nr:hypothetical protein [Acidobacteriota bacterium]